MTVDLGRVSIQLNMHRIRQRSPVIVFPPKLPADIFFSKRIWGGVVFIIVLTKSWMSGKEMSYKAPFYSKASVGKSIGKPQYILYNQVLSAEGMTPSKLNSYL